MRLPRNAPAGKAATAEVQLLLDAAGERPRARVDWALRTHRAYVHRRLRARTGLAGNFRLELELIDQIPEAMRKVLATLPGDSLWALAHVRELEASRETLRALGRHLPGWERWATGFDARGLAASADLMTTFEDRAGADARAAFQRILQVPADVLGAYHLGHRRGAVFWLAVWLVASNLTLAIEDVTVVTLAHELAHHYTHVGLDPDGESWHTEDMAKAGPHVVEGVAQYYTDLVVRDFEREHKDSGPRRAFEALLAVQPAPYTQWQGWAAGHPKRAEVMRSALVRFRSRRMTVLSEFRRLLDEECGRLG